MIRAAVSAAVILAAPAAVILAASAAGAFELALPIDCTLGQTCFIQQYMDRDPGAGVSDFTCGPLAYDGHEGTDFALPTLAAMRAGVTVRAAAAGRVVGLRDAMPDIAMNAPGAPALDGRDCGNGVLIDHGDGWQTQYCHMKRGSILVAEGQEVATGDPLGLVGLSGRTEFPHLHLSLRRNGQDIDPFDSDGTLACGGPPDDPLWADPIAYRPGGILEAGLATAVPAFEAIKDGLPPVASLPTDAPALVVWAHVFGGRAGDRVEFRLSGPGGSVLDHAEPLDRTQARLFRAAGRRMPAGGWSRGDYAAEVTLWRDGAVLERRTVAWRID
jgi:hypothetical protein